MKERFNLTLWTNRPEVARLADEAGITRIGLDLERLGKEKRQKNKGTWISPHTEDQLPAIKEVIHQAAFFVRCNPYGPHSAAEIGRLLAAGVEIIMLPNFSGAAEVESIAQLIDGRAQLIPLIERYAATDEIDELLQIPEIGEFHVGLNDLSFDLKLKNRLALLHHPILETLSGKICTAGRKIGIGGIARPTDHTLPVPTDLVYARLAALNASGALISRSFGLEHFSVAALKAEIELLFNRLEYWRSVAPHTIQQAKAHLITLTQHELP